ncbi:cupin [Candidatus Peregrinibacteria bacterium]|nr:cupin [Candidatus Peregrinibacteria bacterium]
MLEEILGEEPFCRFLEENYLKTPFSIPDRAKSLLSALNWNEFYELAPLIPECDVLVVRNGRLFSDLLPRSGEEVKELHQKGFSIVLRNTQKVAPNLRTLAEDAERELHGEAVIQIYSTPKDFHSFGWHYDVEEVFIIQTNGQKEYYLRQNTVNPHPKLETMPKDMQFERETSPLIASTLIGGDFLYIPGGWWHCAKAIEDSLSISIGVLPRTIRMKTFLETGKLPRDTAQA